MRTRGPGPKAHWLGNIEGWVGNISRNFKFTGVPIALVAISLKLSTLSKISISEEDYNSLKSYFKDDICKLEKLIKKDLSSWK